MDSVSSVTAVDLLGRGTACLVWSSPLADARRNPLRYVDLMGDRKPHLLVKTANNLGAETRIRYVPSTEFYLRDQRAGRPWIRRLPLPVHVVERIETRDRISRNRFVSRYAYHHGHFDVEEREFRGFGLVEQWYTEQLAVLSADGTLAQATNVDAASHVSPGTDPDLVPHRRLPRPAARLAPVRGRVTIARDAGTSFSPTPCCRPG